MNIASDCIHSGWSFTLRLGLEHCLWCPEDFHYSESVRLRIILTISPFVRVLVRVPRRLSEESMSLHQHSRLDSLASNSAPCFKMNTNAFRICPLFPPTEWSTELRRFCAHHRLHGEEHRARDVPEVRDLLAGKPLLLPLSAMYSFTLSLISFTPYANGIITASKSARPSSPNFA